MKRVSDVFDIIWGYVCYGMDYRRVWEVPSQLIKIKERLYYNLQVPLIYIYIYILFSFSYYTFLLMVDGCFYGICGAKWFTRV
jgi:hypothetical protein